MYGIARLKLLLNIETLGELNSRPGSLFSGRGASKMKRRISGKLARPFPLFAYRGAHGGPPVGGGRPGEGF